MDIYKVPTCCSCHIMGYSYVYPPLKPAASSKVDQSPLLNPNAGGSPASGSSGSLIPNLNPPKEFQSFLDDIGNKFNFAARRQPPPKAAQSAQAPVAAVASADAGDLSGRPSVSVPRVRKRPNKIRRPILQRRRIDPGKSRNFLSNLMPDMDILGSEVQEVIDEDTAAHRYETIPISRSDSDEIRSGKSELGDDVVEEIDRPDITLPKVENDKDGNEKKQSINYGYHPIIDFFGNFRFDTA